MIPYTKEPGVCDVSSAFTLEMRNVYMHLVLPFVLCKFADLRRCDDEYPQAMENIPKSYKNLECTYGLLPTGIVIGPFLFGWIRWGCTKHMEGLHKTMCKHKKRA